MYQVTKAPVATNHVLHLLLTLVSCGLWAPVWLLVAIINANTDRTTVTQTYGAVPALPVQPSPAAGVCLRCGLSPCPGHWPAP